MSRVPLYIDNFDLRIAATGVARSAALVTHSSREFARVPGLGAEGWF